MATPSDAYIVSILTFTKPVRRFAWSFPPAQEVSDGSRKRGTGAGGRGGGIRTRRKKTSPFLFTASSSAGTFRPAERERGNPARSIAWYPRRKVVLNAVVHTTYGAFVCPVPREKGWIRILFGKEGEGGGGLRVFVRR